MINKVIVILLKQNNNPNTIHLIQPLKSIKFNNLPSYSIIYILKIYANNYYLVARLFLALYLKRIINIFII